MNPAVCVEDVLWDVLGMNTIDRIANVLPRSDDEAKGQQAHHSEGVVQPEYGAVDVHMTDLN